MEAMAQLIEYPAQREALGRRAREIAVHHFTWDHHVQKILLRLLK
jgi:glycosyltransferase involved in cell wall biosynthesis